MRRLSRCQSGPKTQITRPSLRQPARAAGAAGFAGAYPLRHGGPPTPSQGRAPVSHNPRRKQRMAPGQGPLSARRQRAWSCPRTFWKWTPLRRASSLRSLVPSQPPWPAPCPQMAGPRPPGPGTRPGASPPPRRRKAPRTSRPWRAATSATCGDLTPVASALPGLSPKGTTRGLPPTLVLRQSPLGRIGPKPPQTPWLVGPRAPTWPLSPPTLTWTPPRARPLNWGQPHGGRR